MEHLIRKVLKEESLRNKLLDDVKEYGLEEVLGYIGGSENLFKILKLDDKEMEDLIINHLNGKFYPDYNWGPDLHDFYSHDVSKYGSYDFLIDDRLAYTYERSKKLRILPLVVDPLTKIFGNRWIPVFKKWFETNSGLEVDDIVIIMGTGKIKLY
jgi:hypothetical protein